MSAADKALAKLLETIAQQHALPTISLGLDRVLACLDRLGNPEQSLPPVVHIAGTNGKGSTLAMVRALAEASDLAVHCYTSPHLVRFQERVVLAGAEVGSERLVDALKRTLEAADKIPLTFFEATTIAAFVCFAEVRADVLLLEVGLGGRLDATNVVPHPLLSVITPIDYDHKEFLGDTLADIAREKAGIMKPEVPVVVAEQSEEVMAVLRAHAKTLHSPLVVADRAKYPSTAYALVGVHQQVNAATALAVFSEMAKLLKLPKVADASALEKTVWPARLQRLSTGELVNAAMNAALWLDGGHNPAAGQVLADWVQSQAGRVGLIVGMMKRKDVAGFLKPFLPFGCAIAAVCVEGEDDAMPACELVEQAKMVGFSQVYEASSLEEAIGWHRDASPQPINVMLICGSLYLAGKVLQNHA